MKLTMEDLTFRYIGSNGLTGYPEGVRIPAWCRLRVYEAVGWPRRAPVVIATQIASNPGPSVTNNVEEIAALAWQMLERPEAGMVFIEHYTADSCEEPSSGEEFALVTFQGPGRFSEPDWMFLTRPAVERMLGGAAV